MNELFISTTNATGADYAPLMLEEMLGNWFLLETQVAPLLEAKGRLELAIRQLMEEEQMTKALHPNVDCTLEKGTPIMDYSKLRALFEVLPEGLVRTAYTPAHEKTVQVPESWDMRIAKTFGKYGKDAAAVLEAASTPGAPRLKIRVKPRRGESEGVAQ